jgi:leucyl aminopeptidase
MVGVIPLVENVVSGSAIMPGDIYTSYSGKTVEILNTDAEGRLILADALSYCEKYNPDYIFDFATLTGWASKLHCDIAAAFYSPNAKLHRMIEDIGEECGDRTWGMPKWLEYKSYCKSKVADLKNYDLSVDGCTAGGGYMAAMFLAHFVPSRCIQNWVHFDICNNIDDHIMNANTMNLAINLIKTLVYNK